MLPFRITCRSWSDIHDSSDFVLAPAGHLKLDRQSLARMVGSLRHPRRMDPRGFGGEDAIRI